MSVFGFLDREFPEIGREAGLAAELALTDPRTSCFYSRRVVELCVRWAYKHDRSLRPPYDDDLSALVNAPSFRDLAGDRTYRFAREVIRLGNKAAHDASPPSRYDSVAAASALFQFCYWFARTYSRHHKPSAGLSFDPKSLPDPQKIKTTTVAEVEGLREQLEESEQLAAMARERLLGQEKLEEELTALRARGRTGAPRG